MIVEARAGGMNGHEGPLSHLEEEMGGMGWMMAWMMGLGLLGWVLVIGLLATIAVVLVQMLSRRGPR